MRIPPNNGRVAFCPVLYSSFWGNRWQDPQNASNMAQVHNFLNDLVHSKFMNVLSQYGINGGVYAGRVEATNVPMQLTMAGPDTGYQRIFQEMIDAHALGQPTDLKGSPPVVIVFLDQSTTISDDKLRGSGNPTELNVTHDPNTSPRGFHYFFTTSNGQPLIYAFVAYTFFPVDDPRSVEFMTRVASHEFAEMVTNPLGDGWALPGPEGEIADVCKGNFALIGNWSVEQIWSNVDNRCAAEADNPLSPIGPGPRGTGVGERADAQWHADILPYRRVTPLPPVHFDRQTKTIQIRKKDYFAYYRKVFHPLRHEHIFPNFPVFLRELASILESELKAPKASSGPET